MMTSQKTLADFHKHFTLKSLVSVSLIMEKLKCSRPTATNLISTLLNRRKTYKKNGKGTHYLEPFAITGDANKWYKLRKY